MTTHGHDAPNYDVTTLTSLQQFPDAVMSLRDLPEEERDKVLNKIMNAVKSLSNDEKRKAYANIIVSGIFSFPKDEQIHVARSTFYPLFPEVAEALEHVLEYNEPSL